MFKQYLPEDAKLDTDRITQVNVRTGQAWRVYYDDGTTFLTESMTDMEAMLELIREWNVKTEFGGELEIYTRQQ